MSTQQQQSNFTSTKQFSQQKKVFYQYTNQLVNNDFNLIVYFLLIFIQHLQIIAYQTHQVYKYQNIAVNYFTLFTHFINPQYYLKHSHLMDYLIPISFLIVVVHISFFSYSYYRHKQRIRSKQSTQQISIRKQTNLIATHYLTVIICTVFTTPIFLTSMLVFYCHQGSPYHPYRTCYNTYHLFLILISLVNILWILVINIYYFLFYYTRNPFRYHNFLSLSSSLWNLLKFAIKVIPVCYIIFDQVLAYNILFVFGIAAGLLGYTVISRIIYPYTRYSNKIQRVMIMIEIVSITVSLLFILQAFFTEQKGNGISFIVSFIISIPLSNLAYKLTIHIKQSNILSINQYSKDNIQTIQKMLNYLIVELQQQNVKDEDKRFLKIIKLHNDKCQNLNCQCHIYINKYKQQQLYYLDKKILYKIFIQIIQNCVLTNKKAYSMMLLKSYIQYQKLNNPIKGAFIISKIINQKITFFQQYLINAYLYQVSKSFSDTTTIQTYRIFSEHLIKFQRQAITLAQTYAQFWQQISQQNSSLKKVMNLLSKAQNCKKTIDDQFQILYKIYPTNIRIVDIYKQLYKQVLINYEQFMRYKSLYKDNLQEREQTKLIRLDHQIKFTANQDLIVINTSVNVLNDIFHGGCQIINVTNNVYKVLGYSSQDLIGKNINRFLPKIYTDFHDQLVDNFLSRNTSQIKPRQLIIFPINSSGYLVQCAMVNKIMPSLQYGVNIVSFLLNSKLSKQNLIIYDQRTGLVDSMSQKAESLLLGKKSKKNSISIPDHITDILPAWDYIKQESNDLKKKSAHQMHFAFSNVYLYRSDGPADNKYVKIVTFDLAFQSKIFTMQQCFTQSQNFWVGFQTLVQNTPHQIRIVDKQKTKNNNILENKSGLSQNRQVLGQSPNAILPQTIQKPSIIIQETDKLYKHLPKWYIKLYIIVLVLLLLTLVGLIIFNYVKSIKYYDVLQNDIIIKQNIADGLDLLMESSHTASQYVFSGGDKIIYQRVNVQNATTDLKQLISIGQFIYSQIVSKQRIGEIQISDMMLQVKYYTSPTSTVIKQQTVTDASYQLVLYLLEIYKNSNPLNNLQNSILFVFNNCLNISGQYLNLNQIFTNNLLKNSQKRKSDIIKIVIVILVLFFVSLVWQSIYKLVIDLKVNSVIEIYQAIPIQELEKFPIKCYNFIKYVCPVQTSKTNLHTTVKSIRNLGAVLSNQQNKKQQINSNSSNHLLLNNQLEDEQQDQQFITFSNSLPLRHILFQSIIFLVIWSVLYVVELNQQNKLLEQNLFEVSQWNKITRFRTQLIKSVYLINQHKNRANQWNSTQLIQINKFFYESLNTIEYLLKATTNLDKYLSLTYELIQQSVYIIKNYNITSQQFILNQQKISTLSQTVQIQQIDGLIQSNITQTISNFLSMLELIFIGQIILFLLYAVIYIPKSFRNYYSKNLITQMMFDTLGYKLQNIAKANLRNK